MDRQKLILIFGGALAAATLLTWLLFATTKAPKVDKMVAAVAAARDLPAGHRLRDTDVKMIRIVEKDAPASALLDARTAVARVLLFPVSRNEVLTNARIASLSGAEGLPATIDPGKRAISVPFTDANGVAGLIQPRAHVDVLFTRPGSMVEAMTTTVVEDVIVLAIGRNTEVATAATPPPSGSSSTPSPANVSTSTQRAATLLVTPEQARKLEWAKNQGRISLMLRNPLDRSQGSDPEPTTAFDLSLLSGNKRRLLANNRLWGQLTGQDPDQLSAPKKRPVVVEKKEPPRPRHVVDVFRGDKHVQEIFQ